VSEEPRTDEELVAEASEAPDGDIRAFETLVERHKERIVANCRYLSRSPADAEDLAQEVFVKAFFGLPRFEARSSFKTWLQRIKVNHSLNHLKKQEGKTFVGIDDPGVGHADEMVVQPTAERAARARDAREQIDEILDSMSDSLRVPLIMRDLDQFSYQEIADTLGIGLSAVKMRIKRAREEFRERYTEDAGRPPASVTPSEE